MQIWEYIGQKLVDTRIEQVQIVMIQEVTSWESVPHSSSFGEETEQNFILTTRIQKK